MGEPLWENHQLSLFERNNHDVLLVDRTSEHAIPAEQGVGLARKIGADLLVSLISSGVIQCPWIMSTDADTLIPKDYFSIEPMDASSAITYPFEHTCDQSDIGIATKLYEQSIKHYVQGLALTGSDYAFSTLGSCLAFHCEKYAQARGFPKRSGGEDFYLLNKLAKLGQVESSDALPLLKIKARESNRVPFGTGPAVTRLLQNSNMKDEAIFYNTEIFTHLKQALEQINRRPKSLEEIKLNEIAMNALVNLGLKKALEHANKQNLSDKQYDLHMKSWLDGFKTLKFVHHLRDLRDTEGNSLYPSLTASQLKNLDK